MLIFFPFLFLLSAATTHGQSSIGELEKIHHALSEEEVNKYLSNPTEDGVPGTFLSSLIPSPAFDPSNTCTIEDEQKNETVYEIVVVGQYSSKSSNIELLPTIKIHLSKDDLKSIFGQIPPSENSQGLELSALTNRSKEIWESGRFTVPSFEFDPKSSLGRELFVESLVYASAASSLSEMELTKKIGKIAAEVYQSEDERYGFLSALSNRLYRNYSPTRNPGWNNSHNNPEGIPLPKGDMTLNELMQGAAKFNTFEGGVCNDIVEVVAMVGEDLFPDKDVLTINAGDHFGVVIADGKKSVIIDDSKKLLLTNTLLLSPEISSTNLRINKVENGIQKEIAVVDTELGQLTEAAFDTGTKLLKTSVDISSVVAHYRNKYLQISAGHGQLSDSSAFVVVAKYQRKTDKWNSYLGVGFTSQDFYNDQKTKYQIHLKGGVDRKIFSYVHPKTQIDFTTGIRAEGMLGLNKRESIVNTVPITEMSGSLDLVNRLDMKFGGHNPEAISVRSSLEVEHTLGPNNWGNTTGATSYIDAEGIFKAMKNTSFHLNQINAHVLVEKSIDERIKAFTGANYQGSNVGQHFEVMGGLNIRMPKDAELLVFTSYSVPDLKGFKTKHNLLKPPQGVAVGARYKTKNDIEISTAIRDVAGKPTIEAQVKVPFSKKK